MAETFIRYETEARGRPVIQGSLSRTVQLRQASPTRLIPNPPLFRVSVNRSSDEEPPAGSTASIGGNESEECETVSP